MKLQLLRNATIRLEYADIVILIDPMLGPKHSFDSFAGIEDNPIVNLPISVSEVLNGVDLILISHLHEDHFDSEAQNLPDQAIPILCQPGDQDKIEGYGFNNVVELSNETKWQQVKISRTDGQHGTGKWAQRLNPVSGFVFQFPGEPTTYWIGDSVWCNEVNNVLDQFQPDVVITHSGGAELEDSGPIIMDAAQTMMVCEVLPSAMVIATHMEALDHCMTTRSELRDKAEDFKINPFKLLIPENGEMIKII